MGTISAAEVLRTARERLSVPGAWVQGALASDGAGSFVRPGSKWATCWCADGAVLAVQEAMEAWPAKMPACTPGFWLTQAAMTLGFSTASKLHDAAGTEHADVLTMFDLAIRMAEAAEGEPS